MDISSIFHQSIWGICTRSRQNLTGLVLSCIEAKFATKYAFEISRRDLRNALFYAVLQFHFVVKSFPLSLNFEKILVFGANSEKLDSKILSVLNFFQVFFKQILKKSSIFLEIGTNLPSVE